MYRVLLVDDEFLDLEWMEKHIHWHKYGMTVAGVAVGGFEALAMLQHEKIDVLVSDIKMPNMSGLELARKALDRDPQLKILFMSGYEDFRYAKHAIELGAHGYILKPVDEEELNKALTDIQLRLDLQREREQMEHTLKESLPLLRNEKLISWLEGGPLNETVKDLIARRTGGHAVPSGYELAILEADDVSLKVSKHAEEQRKHVIHSWIEQLMTYLQDDYMIFVCRLEETKLCVVYSIHEDNNLAQRIVDLCRKLGPFTVTIAVSEPAKEIESIPLVFDQTKSILLSKLFCGKNRILRQGDTKDTLIRDAGNLEEILQHLFTAMRNYELVFISDYLSELFVLVNRLGTRMTVHNFTVHIMARLDTNLSELNENLQSILGIDFEHLNILYDFETVDDIESWLRRRCFEISELLHRKKMNRNHKLIIDIVAYIQQNLQVNLTLKEVANVFSFSPNYLGHLFKEEMNENFSEYLIRVRLEHACELLKNPKLKIYEIADSVGYKNLTYFFRQFKELIGVTPNDYRKQCQTRGLL
ncbi:response regulator transcription factor [Paenibacillus sp. strain BS8-2]